MARPSKKDDSSRLMTIRLGKKLHKHAKMMATAKDLTVSEWVCLVVDEKLQETWKSEMLTGYIPSDWADPKGAKK